MLARGVARTRGVLQRAGGFTVITKHVRAMSLWASMPMGPPDPILGLTDAFNKDTDPNKVSLGVGAYRADNGKPHVLNSVRKAEEILLNKNMNHEYAGIAGVPAYIDLSLKFAYGDDCKALAEGRVAGVQALSGTGACRLLGELIVRFKGRGTPIYMPDPTWGNHIPIYTLAGMEVRRYRYYKPETNGLDFDGLLADLKLAENGSLFMFHACAHNPTGIDPTKEQWSRISEVCKEKAHIVFLDCAYQGFASGDPNKDAWALRKFVSDGHCIALGQSFAKNFGLYGQRVGTLSVVCQNADEKARVESQLKMLIRPMYSNPPVYGARLVVEILSDPALKAEWAEECRDMALRIQGMRKALRMTLEKLGSRRKWSHITEQIGMFCYTGLTKEEVLKIRAEKHIYFTADGRISMAGLTSKNVKYVAESIFSVTG